MLLSDGLIARAQAVANLNMFGFNEYGTLGNYEFIDPVDVCATFEGADDSAARLGVEYPDAEFRVRESGDGRFCVMAAEVGDDDVPGEGDNGFAAGEFVGSELSDQAEADAENVGEDAEGIDHEASAEVGEDGIHGSALARDLLG